MRGGTNVQARDVPAMGELSSPLAENFSLIRNGPAHRFPFRISRAVNEHRRVIVKALLAVLSSFSLWYKDWPTTQKSQFRSFTTSLWMCVSWSLYRS